MATVTGNIEADQLAVCAAYDLSEMCRIRRESSEHDFEIRGIGRYSKPHSQPYSPYELIKGVFKQLFEITDSNLEFFIYCRMILNSAHRNDGGDPNTLFYVSLDARHTILKIYREENGNPATEHLEFEYDKPLLRERRNWHDFFMSEAFRYAERSTCRSGRKVGAVFVRDNVALVSTFNGVPSKYPHPEVCPRIAAGCKSGEGLDMCPCNHAETNALAIASREGINLKGARLYCTSKPCSTCIGLLAGVGLSAIVYDEDYPSEVFDTIVQKAKIPVYHISEVKHYD